MSWQKVAAGIVAVGLLGAGFYKSLGGRSALAMRSAAAAPVSALPSPAQPVSEPAYAAESEPMPLSTPASPASSAAPLPQGSNLPDVDPRVARGSKSAPIFMETFSDFQCPSCKSLFVSTSRQLNDNYISTGKIYSVHRDFPLPMHAYSRVAARYGRAAAQLGKFDQVEQVLFDNQEKWEKTGDVDGTVASVLTPAQMTKIRALISNPSIDAAIEKDIALGKTYNVNQTPTTVIHYKGQTYPVVGVIGYDPLHQFIDQLLKQ